MSAAAQSCGLRFFPLASWSEVPPTAVQRQLRQAFQRWGRPLRFRVDNGIPWGSAGDLPTDLALWLIGLGVEVVWNPARRPQHNGVVERSQGTAKRWAEPHTCATVKELQQRLESMDRIQREEYPSLEGRRRYAVFPQLTHSGREYGAAWERKHWDLEKVSAHVAEYTVPRRVDQKGFVSLYNRNYYVGEKYRGRIVYGMLDPEAREWIFADDKGQQLRCRPAEQMTRERIVSLNVTKRRHRSKS
jgi:hypothetical protein